ncbi:MAG TPA: cytochrome c3 family protein [Sedimentisphaerales bacterium]|nr:cytochrome c3 family protein [Sedimentisphaerales bacterium]
MSRNVFSGKCMLRTTVALSAVRVLALVVLLVGTSSVFAQEPCPCPDVQPESCVVCHSGAGARHQAVYDDYADQSILELTIDSVTSVPNGAGAFNATMTFTIKKNGFAYMDVDGLPSLDQKRFYAVTYNSATRMFDNSQSFSNPVALGNGQYSVTAAGITYAPESSNGLVYAYIADGKLDTEGMTLYGDVSNAGKASGDVATYQSVANVSACEKCHGTPYMKHGYRAAAVAGLPDFAACKTCHYDTRAGGHEDWQILVDNPARYAEVHAGDALTTEEEARYAYTAKVMNDVHMSHAMEFPYPQSMSTCATCHEGKLNIILTDANFKVETCKSCHPVTGPAEGTQANRAPALESVMPHGISIGKCTNCHAAGRIAPVFSEIHTGYDKVIYTASGQKYSDAIVVTIDTASMAGNILTIKFSAAESPDLAGLDVADIVPTVLVGLYGYDTKDFIVGPHERDADGNRLLEFAVDGTTVNPRFTVVSAAGGSWEVTADLSMWADMIADGTVKRAEIAVMPALETADGVQVALNSPSRTFDLGTYAFDDGFYGPIVKVTTGCNNCHDALATTFHSPDRGGNIVTCRLCHITKSGGSHLEMQSRSIDSYVHAIHSFQDFDIGDVNFTDPVETLRHELHIEHTYPNFTIKNCESCHNEGTFEVPDQYTSLPGVLSAADEVTTKDRKIGAVPLYVTGPASRACGSCHRAEMINEDEAGELIAFNQHTKQGGYLIEGGDDYASILGQVIDYIMGLFK